MTEEQRERGTEKEHFWQRIEIIQLGEEFLPFDASRERTQVRHSDDGAFAGMRASIRLETGFLGRLPISLSAAPYAKARYAVITPFNRELGYPLDKEDLALPSRAAKMSRLKSELTDVIEGLYLLVFVAREDIASNALLQAFLSQGAAETTRDTSLLLRCLFLTLKFPRGSSFTARALFNPQRNLLRFGPFFPSDTGPLPTAAATRALPGKGAVGRAATQHGNAKQEEDLSEGCDILLPFEQEQLQTIRARFLFLPNLEE
jgi:hypothetical protein